MVSHSYGGEGSSRETLTTTESSECSDADKFPRTVAKIAVSQICESAGFHSIQRSALETLADITIRYLCEVGKVSQFYANLAGRTQSNALDAISAFDDISGASFADPHSLASSSPSIKELFRFMNFGDELPFAKPLPHFPICKTRNPTPSFTQLDEDPPDPHIPPWLPAFPDPHTYQAASVSTEDKHEAQLDKLEQDKQRRKAERSLVSLHLRLCTSRALSSGDNTAPPVINNTSSMGTSPPPASRSFSSELQEPIRLDSDGLHNKAKSSKRPAVCTQNPFLAPPLPADAKEVSPLFFNDMKPSSPAPSTKKIVAPALPSVLDAFRPAIEAASRDVQENGVFLKPSGGILPAVNDRRRVLMTLDFGKRAKEKGVAANLCLGGKEKKRPRTHINDEDKDEKKKRAEQILAQGMDGVDDGAT
eukprot:c16329_g1_i1 orf=211-1470(+)